MRTLFTLFLLLITLFVPPISFAQESPTEPMTSEMESTPSAEQTREVIVEEYVLPYPGLLPDSPLYFVKAARDNIIGFLITDPVKKAEFNLLQADKRLQAGIVLIDKSKNYSLAKDTISKGENYFEEAISKIKEADKRDIEVGALKAKIQQAAIKHDAVLRELHKKAPKDQADGFKQLVTRMEKYEKDVAALIKQTGVKK